MRKVYACPRDTCGVSDDATSVDDDNGDDDENDDDDNEDVDDDVDDDDNLGRRHHRRHRRRLSAASAVDCLSLANYSSASCVARANCGRGSDGPLCAACASGWRVSAHSRRCEKCRQPRTRARSLALLLLAASLAAAFLLVSYRPHAFTSLLPRWGKRALQLLDSLDEGALKLLWATAQVSREREECFFVQRLVVMVGRGALVRCRLKLFEV